MKLIGSIGELKLRKAMGEVRWFQYQLSSGCIDQNTYYDKLTELVMQKVLDATSVCVDVGAHEGDILRLMIKSAPDGTFFVFEPLPHLYKKLSQEFKNQNTHVFDLALSDSQGSSSFNYVVSNPGYSGLKKRRYDRPHEDVVQIEVKTELLDNILSNSKIGKVSFIKIDVEGAEYHVLKGAQAQIKKDKPVIVFEHGMGGSDYYGKTPEDIFQLLSGICGLRISLLSQWLLGKPSLNLKTFCDQFYLCKNYYFMAHE